MGGKAVNSTVISIRVPNGVATAWREKANQRGISLSEYVMERAARPEDAVVDLAADALANVVERERYEP